MTLEQQVHQQEVKIRELTKRVKELEKHSHEPFDFTHLIERLEKLEAKNATQESQD